MGNLTGSLQSWGLLRCITRAPNSFRNGPSTRHARKLRQMVTRTINARKNLDALRLARLKRQAEWNVDHFRNQLRPERISEMREELAYWEAAVRSLEDHGVLPDRRTFDT